MDLRSYAVEREGGKPTRNSFSARNVLYVRNMRSELQKILNFRSLVSIRAPYGTLAKGRGESNPLRTRHSAICRLQLSLLPSTTIFIPEMFPLSLRILATLTVVRFARRYRNWASSGPFDRDADALRRFWHR